MKHFITRSILSVLSVLSCFASLPAMADRPEGQPPVTQVSAAGKEAATDARFNPQAWEALKYGMFIHYGMATYTSRNNENDPRNAAAAASLYAPTDLDPDQWIRVARDAGMKYAVLTAKHSAGHCLWDSKVRFRGREFDYDVATSGNTTDVVAGFVGACKKYDIMPGLYWCLEDHRNKALEPKLQRTAPMPAEFFQFAQDQINELITRYPEVVYYWLDIPAAANAVQLRTLYDLIKTRRPGTVVLFNHGAAKPRGPMTIAGCQEAWPTDVLNTELWPLKEGWFSPEQTWQGETYRLGYEHCDKIGKGWFMVDGEQPRPVEELADLYRNVRAAGGNLLLNVPPDATGRIPDFHVKALMELRPHIERHEAAALMPSPHAR